MEGFSLESMLHGYSIYMYVNTERLILHRIEAVDDVKLTQEQVEEVANQIEEQLYGLQGDINTKYKTKYRSLLFNLKDRKNQV